MGYRHYFYLVEKSEVENVKNMDMNSLTEYAKRQGVELYDESDGMGFYFDSDAFMKKILVFEFGKLYWDDTAERIYKTGFPLFAKPEVQSEFDDYVPFVVGKAGLLEAIKIYNEKALSYYKKLESCEAGEIKKHIGDRIEDLTSGITNTDESKVWSVSRSGEYEHDVFNLVHLLKTIDWERNTLLFFGW